MVRSPCCWRMGLKKGPWTPEEDEILINYVQKYGHDNWRALPRYAGLLRCGKSCRLRWINYLRPDIKRGNFTKEEEDTITELHAKMGNRWSAIAAKLPGRTDNEIKNVWHTHLKKRVTGDQNGTNKKQDKPTSNKTLNNSDNIIPDQTTEPCIKEPENINANTATPPPPGFETPAYTLVSSPQPSCSEISSVVMDSVTPHSEMSDNSSITNMGILDEQMDKGLDYFPIFEGSFWCDPQFDYHDLNSSLDFSDFSTEFIGHAYASPNFTNGNDNLGLWSTSESSIIDDGLDFWCDLFVKAGRSEELPHF